MRTTQMSRWNGEPRYVTVDPFRVMQSFFGGSGTSDENISNRGFTPAVDIRETEEAYEVVAELPGMKKDDVEITLENNLLRLSGERNFEKDTSEESYHRMERVYGRFSRAFNLPQRVDSARVTAAFEDGLLTVTVPKAEEAKPRKIEIA
jgi:HSP20 family protein